MMNRDKEKEKRGERERKFGTPSSVIVSGDAGGGGLVNRKGSVQTRSFGVQRVFAEKSSKCRR